MKYPILIALVFLSACAGSPINVAMSSPEELHDAPSSKLCNTYAYNKNEKALNELIRRGEVRKKFAADVRSGSLKFGMNVVEVMAICGAPNDINNLETRRGDYAQYVFNRYAYRSHCSYAYFTDGAATSFQR